MSTIFSKFSEYMLGLFSKVRRKNNQQNINIRIQNVRKNTKTDP